MRGPGGFSENEKQVAKLVAFPEISPMPERSQSREKGFSSVDSGRNLVGETEKLSWHRRSPARGGI